MKLPIVDLSEWPHVEEWTEVRVTANALYPESDVNYDFTFRSNADNWRYVSEFLDLGGKFAKSFTNIKAQMRVCKFSSTNWVEFKR